MPISKRSVSLWVMVLVLAAAALYHLHATNLWMPQSYSDLLPRIVGTRDALRGMNPYSTPVLHDIQKACYGHVLARGSKLDPQYFSYPALIIPLLLPLVHLSWLLARTLFFAAVIPLLAFSFWWWATKMLPGQSFVTIAAAVLICLSAWPVVWGLRLEQPTVVAFVLMTGAVSAVEKNRGWLSGVLFAVAIIKPQIALPLLLWLGVWSFRRRSFGIFQTFAVSLLALWAAADAIVPDWFSKWLASLHAYTSINRPICEMLFGRWVGLGATAVLAWFCLRRLWVLLDAEAGSADFLRAVALSLAATLLVVPMQPTFLYDQILLIPAIMYSVGHQGISAYAKTARWMMLVSVYASLALLVFSAMAEIWEPRGAMWYILPFVAEPLPLIVVISMLLEVDGKSSQSVPLAAEHR